MSLREKSAWIGLVGLVLCFGAYFGAVAAGVVSGRGSASVHLLLICVLGFALLQAGLHVAAVATTARDGRSPHDERETAIQARSHTFGYYALVTMVLSLGIPGHLGHPAPDLLNFALLAAVLAGLVVTVTQIAMFRRGC